MDNCQELFLAISRSDLAKVKQLISLGVNINQFDPERDVTYTPLTRAFEFRESQIAKVLLEAGSNFLGSHIIWAVDIAIDEGCLDYILALIEAGADINFWQSEDGPFVIEAASRGAIDVVKLLVEAGADVNQTNSKGQFALAQASELGHKEVYDYLVPLTNLKLRAEAEKLMQTGSL